MVAHGGWEVYRMFVHGSTFMGNVSIPTSPVRYEWDSWGPRNSRLFGDGFYNHTMWEVSGSRFITSPPPSTEGIRVVGVLDFTKNAAIMWESNTNPISPPHITQHWDNFTSGDEVRSFAVSQALPTVVINEGVFADSVKTSLPYCFTSRALVTNPADDAACIFGVFLDDERIMCIRVCPL